MNIKDFKPPECPGSWLEIIKQIFSRQQDLMLKYKEIEKLPDPPLSVHLANSQRILKDFAWRAWEEVAEAIEARDKHSDKRTAEEHCKEELADGLHFITELCIFAGVHPSTVNPWPNAVEDTGVLDSGGLMDQYALSFGVELGVTMNFLRNKPWKQSQVPTDERRFRDSLVRTFNKYICVMAASGMSREEVHAYYFRKSEVNKFRQRSNY